MSDLDSKVTWTPEKTARFRKMVLRHVSNGGTVMEACEQFEFETNGVHKARLNHMRWTLYLRHTCREEYKRALDLGRRAKMQRFEQLADQGEDEMDMLSIKDDELANKLLTAVEEIVEDRRQLVTGLQDYKEHLEFGEKRIQELEEDKKLSQAKYEKKEQELEKMRVEFLDKQFKYDQLLENYQQLRNSEAQEQERLQFQLKELQSKYEGLNADYSRFRASSAREIERLESQLREEQLKNTQLVAQVDKIRAENTSLTKRITDFAHQISAVLPAEAIAPASDATASAQPAIAPVPIRPSVGRDTDAAGL